MTKENYDFVDIVKFVLSIFIFIMHIGAFNSQSEAFQLYVIQLPARIGVPFFFVISSFLLFQKSENNDISKATMLHYIKRILLLYALWAIFNLPHILYSSYQFYTKHSAGGGRNCICNNDPHKKYFGTWYFYGLVVFNELYIQRVSILSYF